ncbi:hypothetical protein [Psychrobacter pygoscelis]|uniref:hypothetical protein n=1 Tax=Psychrobacter pygoscelis TaxID=2488563 RepID=UPI0010388200|nr:hypothetical protein [Psychrobacter pygoscelis]
MPELTYQTTEPLVLSPVGVQTNSFMPTADTDYKRGDLLVLSAEGALTHTADHADWTVVCLDDCTAAQANKQIEAKVGISVYTHGEINLNAVTANGTLLNDTQKTTARAHSALSTSITLRKPQNGKGV